jgi:glutamate carboxypeptidase
MAQKDQSADLERALAEVRAHAAELVDLTKRWVLVNSFTENVDGVNRVGGMLREAFEMKGLACEVVPSGPKYGDHLIWRSEAATRPGARPILLIGHHDTVFPPGHFEGWREEGDGRAIGPGSLDMKGGLAIVRGALAALSAVGALDDVPVVAVSVSEEEIGSPASAPRLRELAKGAQCALVFESGRANDMIITRRRGVGALTVTAHGKAAHAGNNHKDGANAIWALARWIDAAQRLTDHARGVTVNVGLVSGGTSKNTVPEKAECRVDMRFESGAAADELIAGLRAALGAAASGVPGTKLEMTGGVSRLPLEKTEASAALMAEYAACAGASGLGTGESPLLGGGSDANTVAAVGVPAIDGLGPRGAGFHTTWEYVELASFLPKAEALVRFLWARRAG